MKIKKFHIYLANLEPAHGTEPGKVRPVVVVQTDMLNGFNSSTVICPLTTRLTETFLTRVRLVKGESGLKEESDIMADQIRSIDNRRFIKEVGKLSTSHAAQLSENLKILILE